MSDVLRSKTSETPSSKRTIRSSVSLLLRVIRRFNSIPHVVHFAVLHLPNTILQHPDVVAVVENAERLGNVIESTFDPVRQSYAWE